MKKLVLITLLAVVLTGCDCNPNLEVQNLPQGQHNLVIYDSCEYLQNTWDRSITHKGNCKYCAERRRKELEKLINTLNNLN